MTKLQQMEERLKEQQKLIDELSDSTEAVSAEVMAKAKDFTTRSLALDIKVALDVLMDLGVKIEPEHMKPIEEALLKSKIEYLKSVESRSDRDTMVDWSDLFKKARK